MRTPFALKNSRRAVVLDPDLLAAVGHDVPPILAAAHLAHLIAAAEQCAPIRTPAASRLDSLSPAAGDLADLARLEYEAREEALAVDDCAADWEAGEDEWWAAAIVEAAVVEEAARRAAAGRRMVARRWRAAVAPSMEGQAVLTVKEEMDEDLKAEGKVEVKEEVKEEREEAPGTANDAQQNAGSGAGAGEPGTAGPATTEEAPATAPAMVPETAAGKGAAADAATEEAPHDAVEGERSASGHGEEAADPGGPAVGVASDTANDGEVVDISLRPSTGDEAADQRETPPTRIECPIVIDLTGDSDSDDAHDDFTATDERNPPRALDGPNGRASRADSPDPPDSPVALRPSLATRSRRRKRVVLSPSPSDHDEAGRRPSRRPRALELANTPEPATTSPAPPSSDARALARLFASPSPTRRRARTKRAKTNPARRFVLSQCKDDGGPSRAGSVNSGRDEFAAPLHSLPASPSHKRRAPSKPGSDGEYVPAPGQIERATRRPAPAHTAADSSAAQQPEGQPPLLRAGPVTRFRAREAAQIAEAASSGSVADHTQATRANDYAAGVEAGYLAARARLLDYADARLHDALSLLADRLAQTPGDGALRRCGQQLLALHTAGRADAALDWGNDVVNVQTPHGVPTCSAPHFGPSPPRLRSPQEDGFARAARLLDCSAGNPPIESSKTTS